MDEIMEILQMIKPEIELDQKDYKKSLVSSGELDSFDIITLVAEINSKYQISLPIKMLIPENFESIENIWKMVCEVKKKDESKCKN